METRGGRAESVVWELATKNCKHNSMGREGRQLEQQLAVVPPFSVFARR
jgi:hypothetical protein